MPRLLLVTSYACPMEGSVVSNLFSHCLLILSTKLFKGGAISPGAVSAVGTCMSYDCAIFTEFYTVREGW